MSPWSARWRNKEVTAAPVGNVLCCDFYSFCLHWSVYSISALSQLQCRTEYVRATRKKKMRQWSIDLPASLVTGMIDAFYGLIASLDFPIGLSFPWMFLSFVSPLETKQN